MISAHLKELIDCCCPDDDRKPLPKRAVPLDVEPDDEIMEMAKEHQKRISVERAAGLRRKVHRYVSAERLAEILAVLAARGPSTVPEVVEAMGLNHTASVRDGLALLQSRELVSMKHLESMKEIARRRGRWVWSVVRR